MERNEAPNASDLVQPGFLSCSRDTSSEHQVTLLGTYAQGSDLVICAALLMSLPFPCVPSTGVQGLFTDSV